VVIGDFWRCSSFVTPAADLIMAWRLRELGVRGGCFIPTTLLVVVRFSSLSIGVHQLYLRSCFLDSDGPGNFDSSPELSV
jgi:hypothetical protein